MGRCISHRPNYKSRARFARSQFVYIKKVKIEEAFKSLVASPNIASKHWVYGQYDYMVGDNTVLRPGKAGAAIVRIPGTKKGVAVTTDCNPRFIYLNPEKGTEIAVCESARNIVAVGAKPMAITNCLNFGTPLNLDVYYQIYHALMGMKNACIAMDTPVTGGNASLYNEGKFGSIYPTPTIGMVGLIKDVHQMMTPEFKNPGDVIYLVGESKDELDGSEYAKVVCGQLGKSCPEISLEIEKKTQKLVSKLIEKKVIVSADDLSFGGLSMALAKAAIASHLGADLTFKSNISKEGFLFGESQSRFLVSVQTENEKKFLKMAAKTSIPVFKLGLVSDSKTLKLEINGEKALIQIEEIKNIYLNSFEKSIS